MALAARLSAEDRISIESLLTEYGWRLDHHGDVGALFLPEGVVLAPALGMRVKGREAISQHMAGLHANPEQVTRHNWLNLRVTEVAADRVVLNTTQQTCLRLAGEAPGTKHWMIGDTHDVVCRDHDGDWRFAERRLEIALPFDVKAG